MLCMKKTFPNEKKQEVPYQLDASFLALLKEENPFPQNYFYIEDDDNYAFFVTYDMKLNILTFGKRQLNLNVTVVGTPCSVSDEGFLTNNESFLFDYLKQRKGATLILNTSKLLKEKGWATGETLPTCVFTNRFQTTEAYLSSLRSDYRHRIKKAIRDCEGFEIRKCGSEIDIYPMYLATYEKSEYKLERLERGFFERVDGVRLVFFKDNVPRGFVLLKPTKEKLVFLLCGMDYRYETADLYYYMLYTILDYGIKGKFPYIDLGQTSEETKLKFGAKLQKKYFYAHHSNPIVNCLVGLFKGSLAYRYDFPDYRVFKTGDKGDSYESTINQTGV